MIPRDNGCESALKNIKHYKIIVLIISINAQMYKTERQKLSVRVRMGYFNP